MASNVRVVARKIGTGGAKIEVSCLVDGFSLRLLRAGSLSKEDFREAVNGELGDLLDKAVDDLIAGRLVERVPREKKESSDGATKGDQE